MFACNDERGNFTSKVDMVDFFDERGFEAKLQGPAVALAKRDETKVRVSRRLFRITGYRSFVGNVCWDEVGMGQGEAKRLLAYLLERGFWAYDWSCEGPWVALIERRRSA